MDPNSFVAGYITAKVLATLAAVILVVFAARRPGRKFFRAAAFSTGLAVLWSAIVIGLVADWTPSILVVQMLGPWAIYVLTAVGSLIPATAVGTGIAANTSR